MICVREVLLKGVTNNCSVISNFVSKLHSNAVLCSSQIGAIRDESKDIRQCVEEFNRDGVTVLPLKVDKEFIEKSKDITISAWKDGLQRAKAIKGYDMKVLCLLHAFEVHFDKKKSIIKLCAVL